MGNCFGSGGSKTSQLSPAVVNELEVVAPAAYRLLARLMTGLTAVQTDATAYGKYYSVAEFSSATGSVDLSALASITDTLVQNTEAAAQFSAKLRREHDLDANRAQQEVCDKFATEGVKILKILFETVCAPGSSFWQVTLGVQAADCLVKRLATQKEFGEKLLSEKSLSLKALDRVISAALEAEKNRGTGKDTKDAEKEKSRAEAELVREFPLSTQALEALLGWVEWAGRKSAVKDAQRARIQKEFSYPPQGGGAAKRNGTVVMDCDRWVTFLSDFHAARHFVVPPSALFPAASRQMIVAQKFPEVCAALAHKQENQPRSGPAMAFFSACAHVWVGELADGAVARSLKKCSQGGGGSSGGDDGGATGRNTRARKFLAEAWRKQTPEDLSVAADELLDVLFASLEESLEATKKAEEGLAHCLLPFAMMLGALKKEDKRTILFTEQKRLRADDGSQDGEERTSEVSAIVFNKQEQEAVAKTHEAMKEYTRASQLFYLEVVGAALQDCHRYSLEGTKRKASSPVLAWLSDVLPFVLETIVLGGAQRTRTADFCVGKAGSGQPPRKLTARERTRQDVCDRLREDLRPPNFALRDAWRRRAADFLDKLIGLANGPGLPPHGDLCQLVAPLLRAPHMEAMDVFLIDSAKRDIYKDDKQMMQQSQAQTPMQTGGAAQTPQDTGIGMEGQDAGEKGFGDTGRGGDGGGGGEGGPPSEDREEGDEEGRMRGASQGAVSVLRRGTEAESGMDGKDGERDDTAPPSEDETDGHERGGRRQTGGGAVRVVRVQGGPGRGGGDRGPGGRRGRFSVTQRSRSGTEVSDGEMSKGSRRGWKARISSLGGESRDRRRSRRASSRSPGGKRRARLSRSALSVEHRQRDASVADLLASRHALADLHSEDEEVSDGFRIRKGTDGSWEEDDSARTGSEVDEEPLPPPPVAAMESLEREMRGKRPTKTGGRMDRSPKGTVENLLTSHGKKVAYHVQPAENLPADEEANPRGPATPPPVSAPFPSQQQQAAKGGSVERRDISASPHGVPQGPSLQGVGRLQSALASSLEVRGPSVLSHGVERPFQNQNQFQQGEPPLLSPSSPPLGEESPMRTTHQDPGYVSGVIQQRAEALASRTVEKMQADVTVALDKKHQEMTAALGRADRAEKELEQARATIHFLQKTLKDTKQELAAQAVESSLQQRMEYQSVGYGSNALFSPSSPPSPSMLFQTGGGTHAGADALLFTPERAPLPPFTSSPPRAARVPSNSLHSPGVLHPASFHPRARGDSPLKPSPISASVAGSVPLPSSPSRHLGLRPDADLHAPGRFLSMYGGGSAAYDASFGASRVGGGRI